MMTSEARWRKGIASATARAACGTGFQAIATRSIAAGIAAGPGISSGRPVSSSTASSVERPSASSTEREATTRSDAAAVNRHPIGLPAGFDMKFRRRAGRLFGRRSRDGQTGIGAELLESGLGAGLALRCVRFELLDQPRRDRAAAGSGRQRERRH